MTGRYLLFVGDNYYPSGGWADFVAASDDIDSLRAEAKRQMTERGMWHHIVDVQTRKIVEGWRP